MSGLLKRLESLLLPVLRGIGRLGLLAPEPPRATGGYGLACRGGLILLFLLGLVLSVPLRGAGLAVMIVATAALLQFFLLQYRGVLRQRSTMLWLAVVAVVLGTVVALLWWRWPARGGAKGDVMVLGAVLGTLALLPLIRAVFTAIFGPHHAESSLPEPDEPSALWFWTGAVGPDRATVVARLADNDNGKDNGDADSATIHYQAESHEGRSDVVEADRHGLARIELRDLRPDHHYKLRVEARRGDKVTGTALGHFKTFPPNMAPADFSLVFGSCMSTGSKGAVFDTIANLEPRPRLFMVTGDLHYENITARRIKPFLDAFDKVHSSYPQRRLYNAIPMAYTWDDHDFGDNDSGHDSPSKKWAQEAYRQAVPSYVDPDQAGAIYQQFSIGRVRVVVSDNRSERGQTSGNLVSPAQEQWLIEQINDPTWPAVIWVSSTPWISSDGDSDNWGAYPDQRRRIAEAIAERSAHLIMVSGDAHMVAIDDGTNSGYAADGSGGFPVLQAAALDRLGSAKGGPFSHGRFAGAGHFGLVTVNDRGHEIEVGLSARSWTGTEIVGHSTVIQTPSIQTPSIETPNPTTTHHQEVL